MSRSGTTLDKQTLIFDEVVWQDDPPPFSEFTLDTDNPVQGKPANASLGAGVFAEAAHPPYWEFTYQLNNAVGLKLTNVNVRDSQSAGSTENVFDTIDFTDFQVTLDDYSIVAYDLASAFTNPASKFSIRENGRRTIGSNPPDTLYQRGLKLTLVNNVASGSDTCNVTLEISVVFRGANNDIDPGGVPVGMKAWPQLAWTWQNDDKSKATKKVVSFWGSVRYTVANQMYTMGGMGGMSANGNVSSFFTDSNDAIKNKVRGNLLTGHTVKNMTAASLGVPIGWGVIFDYATPDITTEIQRLAVTSDYAHMIKHYIWPNPSDVDTTVVSADLELKKARRQANYDNMHVHARMQNKDANGNVQVHAPFCGHSCLHNHWRWTSLSSDGATNGRGWAYRGWGTGAGATAYSTDNAPMVPPNQTVQVAICRRNATRFAANSIINTAAPAGLDPLYKLIWYEATILHPNANEKQVVMDHGVGWAYRYCLPIENSVIAKLYALINSVTTVLSPVGSVISMDQSQVASFFETDVYPFFRYIDGVKTLTGKAVNQVPTGDYNRTNDPTDKTPMISA